MKEITRGLNTFLSPGPSVFLPLIIFIFFMILKLFSKKDVSTLQAIKSSIMLGVAFIGMSMIIGFMVQMFTKPFTVIQNHLNFGSLDLGWSPMSAISWAWQYAILMFPIQIFINLIMLKLRWTKVLNADMWNVWNKVFQGVIVQYFIKLLGASEITSLIIALLVGGIMVVFELKNGDVIYESQKAVTKIPNIVSPHSMFLLAPFVYFIDKILQKLSFFTRSEKEFIKKSRDKANFRTKLVRTLRDNMIVGFILGLFLSVTLVGFDKENWVTYVQLPFNLAAALILFPLIAQLFTKSLVPLGMAIQNIMLSKYNGKEVYIGLDWPFLAGNPKLWIVATMLIPVELIFAVAFSSIPGVAMVFPLASLVNVCLAPALLVICKQDLKSMFVVGSILVPVFLFFGAMTAPAITELAQEKIGQLGESGKLISEHLAKNPDLKITNSGYEAPIFRWGFSAGIAFLGGGFTWKNIVGIILLPSWITLFILYYYSLKKKNQLLRQKEFAEKGIELPKELKPVGANLFKKIFRR